MTFGVCDFSPFGGYGLALAALALVVLGAYDSYPLKRVSFLTFGNPAIGHVCS